MAGSSAGLKMDGVMATEPAPKDKGKRGIWGGESGGKEESDANLDGSGGGQAG